MRSWLLSSEWAGLMESHLKCFVCILAHSFSRQILKLYFLNFFFAGHHTFFSVRGLSHFRWNYAIDFQYTTTLKIHFYDNLSFENCLRKCETFVITFYSRRFESYEIATKFGKLRRTFMILWFLKFY